METRTLFIALFEPWWLLYVESNDFAFCHVCMLATKQKNVSGSCSDQA